MPCKWVAPFALSSCRCRWRMFCTLLIGWWVHDVVLTREEYMGLMGNLLAPEGPSAGETGLSQWLAENHEHIGRRYASEVARHYAKPLGVR